MTTLADLIRNKKSLTGKQEWNLVKLLTYQCRLSSVKKIENVVKYNFLTKFSEKDFCSRLLIEGDDISYIASQDYIAEIKIIRQELIK